LFETFGFVVTSRPILLYNRIERKIKALHLAFGSVVSKNREPNPPGGDCVPDAWRITPGRKDTDGVLGY